MTDMIELTDLEREARTLIAGARNTDWSPAQQVVLNAFVACYASALPAIRIATIGNALCNSLYSSQELQPVLTALVRRKVLRTRSIKGTRHYELAFS